MDNNTRSQMSKQEAIDILTEMFPPPHTVIVNTTQHIGGLNPLSQVSALVAIGQAPGWHYLHHEMAYDEQNSNDEGGWATVVNRIREKHEAEQELLDAIVEVQP